MSKTDPAAMLKIARMGITHVETAGLYGMTADKFAEALREAGLHATSMHVGLDELKKNPQGVIATRKHSARSTSAPPGIRTGCVHRGRRAQGDRRLQRDRQDDEGRGPQFFYHNHGYEPVSYGDGTLLDLIIQETDPAS